MIRVGRIIGRGGYPSYEGFTTIPIISTVKEYNSLSPFYLRTKEGILFENLWQFSKVYEEVPAIKTASWTHRKETHIEEGAITSAYWKWRTKGLLTNRAIRYPVGKKLARSCKFAIPYYASDDSEHLDYVTARKVNYLPVYKCLVKKQVKYKELKSRLDSGENLLLVDYDGPHEESLQYYMNKYDVDENFIENGTVLATKENLEILLNDSKHSFGHCYCIAAALLGIKLD